jgi:hypothetical protein
MSRRFRILLACSLAFPWVSWAQSTDVKAIKAGNLYINLPGEFDFSEEALTNALPST